MRPILPTFVALLAVTALTGCAVKQAFPETLPPEQVWSALVAVAETPDYSHQDPAKRWVVVENRVHADPDRARIEIYRRLDRSLHRPGARPLRQQRTWRFRVDLETWQRGEQTRAIATFSPRGPSIPMQAKEEGERFFADVRRFLESDDDARAEGS